MLTKTSIALAAALIVGAASAASASQNGMDKGAVEPGNGGANPVDHPKWFHIKQHAVTKHMHHTAHSETQEQKTP